MAEEIPSPYPSEPYKSNCSSYPPILLNYPIILKFENVVYKVGPTAVGKARRTRVEKTILNGVSGSACPGEILAMLGPSGSGKTTLLTALGGRLLDGELSGVITYNGRRCFSSSIRRLTGFVAQEDVLYPHLTVRETLLFTGLLRLPQNLSLEKKLQQVENVISELGLSSCRESMIGGGGSAAAFRGISGGEKKRVSIGQEMLISPSLLLLDEPTSGLDSTTALRTLTMIKRLASSGRTVVVTIHQPSSRIYHMFDKVVLLSEGGFPIYYGHASSALDYFSSLGFSIPYSVNPADLMLDLANGIAPDLDQDELSNGNMELEKETIREMLLFAYDVNIRSRIKHEFLSSDGDIHYDNAKDGRRVRKGEQWCTSWRHQFKILVLRGLIERRHEAFNGLRIFQVLTVAFLAGLLWWQTPTSHIGDQVTMLFFFAVFWGFYPLYNAVFTFPQEKSMLMKERWSGMYSLSSYFLAKTVVDLPLELALPTAFTFILYWMGGLKPQPNTFILHLFIVLYNVLVSQSLGLALGAILMDVKKATTLASVTTMVFLIAGGYYVQKIPFFIAWLKYLSYSFYCFKLLLGVQYGEDDVYECSPGVYCKVVDFPAVSSVGLKHLWVDVLIMAIMLVGYRFVAYLALRRLR